MTADTEYITCGSCGREVRFNASLPAYHSSAFGKCDDPNCGYTGQYVHTDGVDCGNLMWVQRSEVGT